MGPSFGWEKLPTEKWEVEGLSHLFFFFFFFFLEYDEDAPPF
jgi:hypothetical protein